MAVPLILTAAGEFAAPYLIKEATKLGIKKFIQNYGSTAFQSIAAGVTGGMIAQETPPLDLQQEKLFGMPVSHIAGQGKVYSDITEPKKEKPLEYIETVHGGKGPLEPIKAEPFPIETKVEPIQEGFEKPEPIETTKGFEVPSEKKIVPPGFEKPEPLGTDILTKDIAKQTKDLVTKEPEFGALTEVEKQTALLEKEGKPDFYSRAIKSIEDAKPNKLTKTKWKSYIQSTKEELDYLGLTEFLKGNESVTKKELLDFVESKNIAPNITVRTVPKDQMNPMWKDYSLGGEQQEHIVFQVKPEFYDVNQGKKPTIDSYVFTSEHFGHQYGKNNFAHARTQVGFDADASPKYDDLDSEVSELFDNTLIIDEIQSDWIQKLQKEGSAKEWKIIKGSDITKEFLEKNYPGEYKIKNETSPSGYTPISYLHSKDLKGKFIPTKSIFSKEYYIFNKEGLYFGHNFNTRSLELAEREVAKRAVPDFPLKDSKKFVELVLNEMIRKAVKDGRDSIAITNGQIQYNRYEAMEEKEKKGLKKFYDTFVYDQLNKIAKNYGVKLERIDINEGSEMAPKELEDIHLDNKIKKAQDQKFVFQKITLQELWDRTKDTDIPAHAALYTTEGRGQGADYIESYLIAYVASQAATDQTRETTGAAWNALRHNEVYVWKTSAGETAWISWEMPIVPVNDTSAITGENDLSIYTKYLKQWKPPEGVDLSYEQDPEQLIKMKLPKKLKKDFLSKSIRLTKKIDEQTQRLFT